MIRRRRSGRKHTVQLKEAMRGYMMDGQIAQQSPRALDLKAQRLGYFVSWGEKQEIADLLAATPNSVPAFVVHLPGLPPPELNPPLPPPAAPIPATPIT